MNTIITEAETVDLSHYGVNQDIDTIVTCVKAIERLAEKYQVYEGDSKYLNVNTDEFWETLHNVNVQLYKREAELFVSPEDLIFYKNGVLFYPPEYLQSLFGALEYLEDLVNELKDESYRILEIARSKFDGY